MKPPPAVLIFSAADGTGGAGVCADFRAVAACGGLPLGVITALTAQNLDGVAAVWRAPPQQIRAQFAALQNAPVRAAKIGALPAAAVVAECLDKLGGIPAVWDPVLAPSFGAPFASAREIARLKKELLPRVFVITPNRAELAALSGGADVAAGAQKLRAAGAKFVLATDTVPGAEVVCELYGAGEKPLWRAKTRRRRAEFHGGGCLLSAAVAARLAAGDSMEKAAQTAHDTVAAALSRARKIPQLGRQWLPG